MNLILSLTEAQSLIRKQLNLPNDIGIAILENKKTEPKKENARYFTHVSGFCEGTLYLEYIGDKCYCVSRDGGRQSCYLSLRRAVMLVKQGDWKEITKEDAMQLREFAGK
jgi:hypothetical protein